MNNSSDQPVGSTRGDTSRPTNGSKARHRTTKSLTLGKARRGMGANYD